jgi:hypothetical protein
MNITNLFLLASVGLAAFAFTPVAEAHEHHHHHQDAGQQLDRPYYYKSQPEVIYTNSGLPWSRGTSDSVISIAGNRYYRNHRP